MEISTREIPEEPATLHDGLKWSYPNPDDRRRKVRVEFCSEFRVASRDEWGDQEYYDIFNTFEDAMTEFYEQRRRVDAGEIDSAEIEVVLGWWDVEGLVDWDEIEIYHYGRREYLEA